MLETGRCWILQIHVCFGNAETGQCSTRNKMPFLLHHSFRQKLSYVSCTSYCRSCTFAVSGEERFIPIEFFAHSYSSLFGIEIPEKPITCKLNWNTTHQKQIILNDSCFATFVYAFWAARNHWRIFLEPWRCVQKVRFEGFYRDICIWG